MSKKEVKKSEIEKLYNQLGISPKSNKLIEYPFFNSKVMYIYRRSIKRLSDIFYSLTLNLNSGPSYFQFFSLANNWI